MRVFSFLRMAAATHPMTDQFSKDRLNGHAQRGKKVYTYKLFYPSSGKLSINFELRTLGTALAVVSKKIVSQLSLRRST